MINTTYLCQIHTYINCRAIHGCTFLSRALKFSIITGLDFPAIKHVINYDMPEEIENYVHRIGRTGRGDAQGYATTFINKSVETGVLLDLKHLLIEVNQEFYNPAMFSLYPKHFNFIFLYERNALFIIFLKFLYN